MSGFPPPRDKRVTLDNWDRGPFNRWTFQHIREVFPTTEVSRGGGPVWRLEEDLQDFDDLEVELSRNGKRYRAIEVLERTYTDGFVLLHNGKVVYERYFNDMQPATRHLSQSVAKSVTATVCGILIHQGMIDPDAPLALLVPELQDGGYADATLRQVLDMRSGVRFSENYTDPESDVTYLDRACLWKPHRENALLSVLEIPATLAKEREHGGSFEYRSIETDVMAWAMQKATGRRLADLVSELLWQPMGAESDADYTVDRSGYALACGGFNATLRDYARVGLLYLNDGRRSQRQIVPKQWVCETMHKGDRHAFIQSEWFALWPRGAYKNKFWVRDFELGQIRARGVFGQSIYVDKSNSLVAACVSSWPDFENVKYELDELDLIDALAGSLNS